MRSVILALALASFVVPAAAAAQGLGDTAARERERRESEAKKKEAPVPVYTDHDLAVYRPDGAESDSEGDSDASSASASRDERETSRSSRSARDRDDEPDRDAAREAEERVSQLEAQIQELQSRLNPMSMDYIYGQARSADAANEEIRVREELKRLEQRLQDARRDVDTARAAGDGPRRERSSSTVH